MAIEFIEDNNLRILKVVLENNIWVASIDPRFHSIVYRNTITLSALEHDTINSKMKELQGEPKVTVYEDNLPDDYEVN